jgi:hypothetical protein
MARLRWIVIYIAIATAGIYALLQIPTLAFNLVYGQTEPTSCAGYDDGKCEFNPAVVEWLQQTGGKNHVADPAPAASTPIMPPRFEGK